MSASLRELQGLADQILEVLGVRIRAELVIRYGDGLVLKLETRTVHQPLPASTPPAHLRVAAAVRREPA